jgi:hypothetical protein
MLSRIYEFGHFVRLLVGIGLVFGLARTNLIDDISYSREVRDDSRPDGPFITLYDERTFYCTVVPLEGCPPSICLFR